MDMYLRKSGKIFSIIIYLVFPCTGAGHIVCSTLFGINLIKDVAGMEKIGERYRSCDERLPGKVFGLRRQCVHSAVLW